MKKVVLYFQYSTGSYRWAVKIATTYGNPFVNLQIRETDQAQGFVHMFYDEMGSNQDFVILSMADGSIIQHLQFYTTQLVMAEYIDDKIFMFFRRQTSLSQNPKMGYWIYDQTGSLPSQAIRLTDMEDRVYNGYVKASDFIAISTIYETGEINQLLMLQILPGQLVQPMWYKGVGFESDNKFMSALSGVTDKFIFGCQTTPTGPNKFLIYKIWSPNFVVPDETQNSNYFTKYKVSDAVDEYECYDINAINSDQVYVATMTTDTLGKSLQLFQVTLSTMQYTKKTWKSNMGNYIKQITIVDYDKLYIAGSDAWQFLATFTTFSSADYLSYLIYTDQTQSYYDVTFENIDSTLYTLDTQPITTYFSVTLPLPTEVTDLLLSIQLYSQISEALINTPQNGKGTCLIKVVPDVNTIYDYYITETTYFSPSMDASSFPKCTIGQCASFGITALSTPVAATSPISYDSGMNQAKVYTTSTSFNNVIYDVIYLAKPPPFSYTNCQLFYIPFSVKMNYATITPTTQVSKMYYTINDNVQQIILNPFLKTPSTAIDSRFDFEYSLVDQSNRAYTDPSSQLYKLSTAITNFDTKLGSLDFYSNDNNLAGKYVIYVKAKFSGYNPTYSVKTSQSTVLTIYSYVGQPDPCTSVTLTPSVSLTPIYSLVGETLQYTITPWKSSDTTGTCNVVQYSLTTNNPAFITLPNTAFSEVFIIPKLQALAGQYNIELQGTLSQGLVVPKTTDIQQYPLIVISLDVTYISGESIPDYSYYVGDPILTIPIPLMTASTSQFQVVQTFTNAAGTTIDSSIFTYLESNRKLLVYATQASKIGFYPFKLAAKFDIPIDYSVERNFIIGVYSKCEKNLIKSSSIPDISYNIADPSKEFQFNAWTMNITECGPIKEYTATLENGMSLPSFIKFDGKLRKLSIQTNSASDYGEHRVKVSGVTEKYSTESITESVIIIKIGCKVSAVTPNDAGSNWELIIGNFKTAVFTYNAVTLSPLDCSLLDITQTVKYEVSLSSGGTLPTFITFAQNSRQFTITDNGQLTPGQVKLMITVQLYQGSSVLITKAFIKTLNFIASTPLTALPSNLVGAIQLPQVFLKCNLNETITYVSEDFAKLITNFDSYLLDNPKNLPYVTLSRQVLKISPTRQQDLGKQKVYLTSSDDMNTKYMQIINLEIYTTSELLKIKEVPLTFKISSISRTGKVQLKFNQFMLTPQNASIIDSKYLSLQIVNIENRVQSYNYTWETKLFNDGIMIIQIQFQNPFEVSRNSYDQIVITVVDNSLLVSLANQQYLKLGTQIKENIPRQLDKSSQAMEKLADSMQGSINSAMSSALGGPVVALILNRIWGMVNSVQIVLLLPLGDIELPANTQLTSQAIQSGSQQQFMKALSLDNFEFQNKKPFNKQFDEQGFKSVYIIDNLRPLFKNINLIFIIITVFLILDGILTFIVQKNINIFNKIRYMFAFNFIVKLYIENSLQLFVFSLIDILESEKVTMSQKASTFFSTVSIALLFSLTVGSYFLVKKQTNDSLQSMETRYPSIAVLYQLLEKYKRSSLLFYSVFITRRFLVAFVYVMMRDYQGVQLMIQILITLSMLMYLNKYPPYSSQTMNIIEYVNELIVISCQYYLLTFAQLTQDQDLLRSQLGLGFSLLIIFQFVGSFLAVILTKIIKLYPTVRQFYYKLLFKLQSKGYCKPNKAKIYQKQDEMQETQIIAEPKDPVQILYYDTFQKDMQLRRDMAEQDAVNNYQFDSQKQLNNIKVEVKTAGQGNKLPIEEEIEHYYCEQYKPPGGVGSVIDKMIEIDQQDPAYNIRQRFNKQYQTMNNPQVYVNQEYIEGQQMFY